LDFVKDDGTQIDLEAAFFELKMEAMEEVHTKLSQILSVDEIITKHS